MVRNLGVYREEWIEFLLRSRNGLNEIKKLKLINTEERTIVKNISIKGTDIYIKTLGIGDVTTI